MSDSQTTNWCAKIFELGYDVSFHMDCEGEYWKIKAVNRANRKVRSASDRLFARNTDAIAKVLYERLIGETE